MKKITIAIIAGSRDRASQLHDDIEQTGLATIMVETPGYCMSTTDWSVRQLIDADPEIIVIDIGDYAAALQTPQVVHTAIPNARLLVTSSIADPQLIIELMRAGVREFLPSPLTQDALVQAFNRYIEEKLRAHKHTQTRAKRGKLYCITSGKHGSGATTVAINLAGIIAARSGQRTALLDMDRPLGDAAAYLNVKPNFTISDALSAGPRMDSVLLESYMRPSHGFQVLPGFRDHSADAALTSEKLAHLLEVALMTFDHTVVDLPTILDEEQVKVITRHASTILLVLTPELPAIWRMERLIVYLTRLQATERVRVVLNRVTRSEDINDADIESVLRLPLSCKLPNEYAACINAINAGTLLDSNNTRHLGKALTALAVDIAGLPEVESRRGLFGMLLKPSMGGTNA